ncbi:MAG TPA: ABC transporter ATP-binding protein [Clostridiales bacterium]|jgi:putative ABC transport system ATP-binding protein|nr:ABC transporter ATP-binding protein [Clostridiales bacterium]
MPNILSVKNLSYYYQDGDTRRFILRDASFDFERGKFYTILGESGSGKTTFLAMIAALDTPKGGEVLFEGVNISRIGYENYRRNKVGMVFQSYNLIPYMTAVENVLVAMSITENKIPKDKKATAYNLLRYVGIDKTKADRTVNKLSGGEQQRVAIARAVATDVDLLLADEPTGNLDEEKEMEIVEIFKSLAHDYNKCVIIVTHSSDIAAQADEVIRLKKGVFTYDGQFSG